MENDVLQLIDEIFNDFKPIPESKKYWLVRTQGGSYYESFYHHNFIAIGHDQVKISEIQRIANESGKDQKLIQRNIRNYCKDLFNKDDRPGLIANQIFKFVYQVRKGDTVVIPSENSDIIAIGVVNSTPLLSISPSDVVKTNCPYLKRKSITWIKTINRFRLDPFFYKLFQAHQAINDITPYYEVIERVMGNFFVKNDTANLVLNVATDEPINAKKLFQVGHYLLDYCQSFFEYYNLPFNVDDVEVKINLNSQGKIQFKTVNLRSIWLMGILVVALNGGGLKINYGGFNLDLSSDGLIKKVIDYQNNYYDREVKNKILNGIDSLHIQSPTDVVTVLKQFSTNKDLPK